MTGDISSARRLIVRMMVPSLLVLLHGLPVLLAVAVFRGAAATIGLFASLPATVAYLLSFPLFAGVLSRPFVHGVKDGRFPRDLGHNVYGPRRLYALCWTTVYYHPAVYHVVLALPWLKHLTFRLFGYKGSTNFTVYPDTWIRDLPLLSIGDGAYLANRSTIGSNICLKSGDILVGSIDIGDRAMIGHLSIIGPHNVIGADAEIGVGTTLGMKVSVGRSSKVGAIVGLNHGAIIGDACNVESMSYVGLRATVPKGSRIGSAGRVGDRETAGESAEIVHRNVATKQAATTAPAK